MSNYRRALTAGGTYFFTVALANRKSRLLTENIDILRHSYWRVQQNYPFETVAICVLPEHIHAIWTLPPDDSNYALRWQLIKRYFSRHFQAASQRSESKIKHRDKGIWQLRYLEHQIRDDTDLQRRVDYIHYNPVKHGYVLNCIDWQFSSFHRFVKRGMLPENWAANTLVSNLEMYE